MVMILGFVYIINIILHIYSPQYIIWGSKEVYDFTGSGQFYYTTFSLPPTYGKQKCVEATRVMYWFYEVH